MNSPIFASFREYQGASHVCFDGLYFVVLTPIDIGPSSFASTVDDVCWFDGIKDSVHFGLILHPHVCGFDILALLDEELSQLVPNPAILAPDEEFVGCHGCCSFG